MRICSLNEGGNVGVQDRSEDGVESELHDQLSELLRGDEPRRQWFRKLADFRLFLPPRHFEGISAAFMDRLGHQLEDMLLSCKYRGELCGPHNFSSKDFHVPEKRCGLLHIITVLARSTYVVLWVGVWRGESGIPLAVAEELG
ncbi:hypothetical protein CB1_000848008 [Camelus ferus]|nr:hypothetical protein CB1_000848008 [Camelus ferus]